MNELHKAIKNYFDEQKFEKYLIVQIFEILDDILIITTTVGIIIIINLFLLKLVQKYYQKWQSNRLKKKLEILDESMQHISGKIFRSISEIQPSLLNIPKNQYLGINSTDSFNESFIDHNNEYTEL